MDSGARSSLLSEEGSDRYSEESSTLANVTAHQEYFCDGVMPIAVVGIGCRFPGGASSPSKFWEMIANGRSGWSKVPATRFTESSFYHPSSDISGTASIPCSQIIWFLMAEDSVVQYDRWTLS